MEGRTKEIRDEFWIWDKIWVWDEVWNDGKMRILRGKGGIRSKYFIVAIVTKQRKGIFCCIIHIPWTKCVFKR